MYGIHINRKSNSCILEERKREIFELCWFLRLCNAVDQSTDLSIDILKYGINYPLSYSERYFQWRDKVLTDLRINVKKIDTSRYGDYRNIYYFLCEDCPFKRASGMIIICESLFQR